MDWLSDMLATGVSEKTVLRRQADAVWAFATVQRSLVASPEPPDNIAQVMYEWVAAGLITPPQAQALEASIPVDDEPWAPPGTPRAARKPPPVRKLRTTAPDLRLDLSPRDLHLATLVIVGGGVLLLFAVVTSDGVRAALFATAAVAGGVIVWRSLPLAPALGHEALRRRRALCADAYTATMVFAALAFAEFCTATGFLEQRTELSNLLGGGTFSQVDRSWVVFWTSVLALALSIFGMVLVFRISFVLFAILCACVGGVVVDQKIGVDWAAHHHVALEFTGMIILALVVALAWLPGVPRVARQCIVVIGTTGIIVVAEVAGDSGHLYFDAFGVAITCAALLLGQSHHQWGLALAGAAGIVALDLDVGLRAFHQAAPIAALSMLSIVAGAGLGLGVRQYRASGAMAAGPPHPAA